MTNLKLHVDPADQHEPESDSIPFPGVKPPRPWSPRSATATITRSPVVVRPSRRTDPAEDAIAHVEAALNQVEARFARLRLLVDDGGTGDDRPRAA